MNWKKILLAAVASGLVSGTAFAQQPNDAAYQTMLQNRHFAVVYHEEGTDESVMIAADGDTRIVYKGTHGKKEINWAAEALFRDGKLYRFFTADKERRGRVLPLGDINRSDLDPEEDWPAVYRMMALPKGLAPFAWNDAWGSRPASVTQPAFNGSSQRTVDKDTYDCDQYISEIHTQAGTTSGMIAYNMLYKGGRLAKVQRYLLWDGREKLLETLAISDLTNELAANVFAPWSSPIKVYKADEADFNDLMDYRVQVEELGGAPDAKK